MKWDALVTVANLLNVSGHFGEGQAEAVRAGRLHRVTVSHFTSRRASAAFRERGGHIHKSTTDRYGGWKPAITEIPASRLQPFSF